MTKEEYIVRVQLLGAQIQYIDSPGTPIESIYLGGEYTGISNLFNGEPCIRYRGVNYTFEKHLEMLMEIANDQ